MKSKKLIPPPNFAHVEDQLYRSGEPGELNFPFVKTLQLKTVIFVGLEEPSEAFRRFVDEQHIDLMDFSINDDTPKDGLAKLLSKPLSTDIVQAALHRVLDSRSYPIMIMSTMGRHRTGTLVGVLRKFQRWNLASIFGEYRRFAGSGKVRILNEQFIELFDTKVLKIPASPPAWVARARSTASANMASADADTKQEV